MMAPTEPVPVLKFEGIRKEYFGNTVLKGVDLEVHPGEVVCLLGENGAGKSTLMNILFGMPVIHQTGGFEGVVRLAGEPVTVRSPQEAMQRGIGMVHQEFMLIDGFTVWENLRLNRELTRRSVFTPVAPLLESLDLDSMRDRAREALTTIGMKMIDIESPVGTLPVGYRQFVEIAREVDRESVKLLVLDEPSAVLTESEADQLLGAMRTLTARGIAIMFITHRLKEVMEVGDRIYVLRDGEMVGSKRVGATSVSEIAQMMVGRKVEIQELKDRQESASRSDVLEIEDLRVEMPGEPLRGVSLKVHRGEVLGVGGLAGHGKLALANGILGLFPTTGRIRLEGRDLPLGDPRGVLRERVAFLSEDRKGVGLLLDESIAINICIGSHHIQGRFRTGPLGAFADLAAMATHSESMIRDLDIRCTGPHQVVRRLSGGNQQKVAIAKAITLDPTVLLVSEPTRGVDIGAKKLILDTLQALNEKGMTILFTSSELAELRSIADRIAIITDGRLSAVLNPSDPDEMFGLAMAGELEREAV